MFARFSVFGAVSAVLLAAFLAICSLRIEIGG
jgi:hypothetical protein